jgi:competence protein ComEC
MSRAATKRTWPVSLQTIVLIATLFVLSMGLWAQAGAWSPWSQNALRVWMLDVGQGDAFFIEFPTGEQMLIDAGRDDTVLAKLGSLMVPWDRSLDAILITHPDADHITGFSAILDRYEVAVIYETGARAHTAQDEALASRIAREPANHLLLQTGDEIVVGDVALTVVWPDQTFEKAYPENRNDTSLSFLLEYGQTTMLFTGDVEALAEEEIGPRSGDIDVLKVGHHGSLTSSSWEFLQRTRPEVALVSAGRDNQYGHPHPIILTRLEDIGAAIYRTDTDTDILIISYGGEPQVQHHPLPF